MSDTKRVPVEPTTAAGVLRKYQKQCDPEGIEVQVSRQALDEVLDRLEQLEAAAPAKLLDLVAERGKRIAELEAEVMAEHDRLLLTVDRAEAAEKENEIIKSRQAEAYAEVEIQIRKRKAAEATLKRVRAELEKAHQLNRQLNLLIESKVSHRPSLYQKLKAVGAEISECGAVRVSTDNAMNAIRKTAIKEAGGFWWCPRCGEVDATRVTYEEEHDACGMSVMWRTDTQPDELARLERIAELAKQLEHYQFECDAGPLRLCVHWTELRELAEGHIKEAGDE